MPNNMADGTVIYHSMWNGAEIIYTYCKEKDGYNIKIRSPKGTERIYGFRTRSQLIEGDKFHLRETALAKE